MDKFDNVDEKVSSTPILNCTWVEHYDIGCEFHVKAQCTLSIILCTNKKEMNWYQMKNFVFSFEN
jgi:hypothetical protein